MLKVGFESQNKSTLQECIDYEFKAEELEDYQCDTCSPDVPAGSSDKKAKRPNGSIQRKIWRLPQNLIVVLKRFNPNGSKCQADFDTGLVQKFTPWFSDQSPESSRLADYNLQSVVDHHGSSGGGHYVAQIKNPLTGKWNVYDDENVSTLKDGSSVFLGRHSYILFYRKV